MFSNMKTNGGTGVKDSLPSYNIYIAIRVLWIKKFLGFLLCTFLKNLLQSFV